MSIAHSHVLIVDDEPANVLLLRRLLEREGIGTISTAGDGEEALSTLAAEVPDLLLLDLSMPRMDGYEVLRRMRLMFPPHDAPPVLVLTADISPWAKTEALSLGASDFVVKPFDTVEVILRVSNLLQSHRLRVELAQRNAELQRLVRSRTRELDAARIEVLERLAIAAEFRDDETSEHTKRVGRNAGLLAVEIGTDPAFAERIRLASPLHDIGKIGIPDEILLKPGKLTEEEFDVIKRHVTIGSRILDGSSSPVMQLAHDIALGHHERWDGSGYLGMVGTDINLAARIVAAADVFDALTSRRPYKDPWPWDRAVEHIASQRGLHFDPGVVEAFMHLWDRGEMLGSSDVDTMHRQQGS